MSGVILAGGEGRRLGGRDKGLVSFRGRPLIEHVLERLRPQLAELVISANRNREIYTRYGLPVVADPPPGGLGPLSGILAAMRTSEAAYVLGVPCDCPFLPTDLVRQLHERLAADGAEVCVASDGEHLQPAVLLQRRDLADELGAWLAGGNRRVLSWVESRRFTVAEFSKARACFTNINRPDDLRRVD